MLRTRVATAVALAAVLLAALWLLPPGGWTAFVILVAAAGAFEWAGFARKSGASRLVYTVATTAACAAAAFVAHPLAAEQHSIGLVAVYTASALFWALGAPAWLRKLPAAPSSGLVLMLGWIVLIPTVLALVQLRAAGPVLLLMLMAIVWIADIAAYFSGRAFGKHKLAPRVSPGKSWEGVIGALAATGAYALLWHALAPQFRPALPAMFAGAGGFVVFVWLLTAASIVGDLFESAMKRQAGLKDSSQLLPGHGGVLDRIDALTPVLPIAALALAR